MTLTKSSMPWNQIGLALRMSPAASSPKELWDFLLKLATEEIKERPIKVGNGQGTPGFSSQ